MALKFEFEVNLKEHLATPATPSAWPQGQVQTFCWGKGSALMLLINCGRKGSPLQTPKIPRKNIIKSSLCTSQPHHSAQPRLGLDRKITPAPCRSLNHKWVPASGRQALSVCWRMGVSGTWMESGYASRWFRQTTESFLKPKIYKCL